MDKILVEVFLPALNRCFDVFIPLKSRLHEISLLLTSTFKEVTGNYLGVTEDTLICDRTTGTILNINMTAEELGLRNGSKLMFI